VTGPRLVAHQVALEQRAFWRNPETAFFTFALPIGLLLIFGFVSGDERLEGRPGLEALTLFVPGILAFGIVVAAYGTLAGNIASLRAEGILKRMRATPLPASTYLGGQLLSTVATSLLIAVTTVVLGQIAFGVAPRTDRIGVLVATLVAAIACFASLGLAISAFIPTARAAGPITNATYLPLAVVSGTFDSDLTLPAWLDRIVDAFPIRALTDGLRAAYDPAVAEWPARDLLVLAVWALAGTALALRFFRWEPHR
jgi:ABC-2 type transport system permease protein